MRRSRSGLAALACLAAVSAGVLGFAGSGAHTAPPLAASIDEAGWQGVLGVRAAVSTAQRYIVLLRAPSLTSRVREAGGTASEAVMRRWTTSALGAQEQFLSRLAARGARVTPEYRYARVLNAFSASLDPTTLAVLERDREVAGVYPVRVAYPMQVETTTGFATISAVPSFGLPGLDGRGVTIALLDTGVDRSHPYLTDSVLSGIDVIRPGSGGVAQPNPSIPGRPERHGTELAGVITGSDGPAGLHGVAPGASILPIRIAGWQPDAEGGYTVYSRTDQIIAGLEAAVDPNGDGDTLDAVRIALVGVGEPYAAFADGPLARAVAGATALDVLVLAPAGNDGRAGPVFGSVAGPAGTPDTLAVAASDGRITAPTVRVHVRAGLRVLYDGTMPLGGAPTRTVTATVTTVARPAALKGIAGLFSSAGLSTVAGRAALLPRGVLSDETVEEAATAGALAVLVDGVLPAGAFSLDVPTGIPVVGLPDELAESIRTLGAQGIPVVVSIGAPSTAKSLNGGVAAFSSEGLAFDAAQKPELLAPGVAVPTAEPGRGEGGEIRYGTVSGTSVAAAAAAGAAAILAQGRPRASAADLRALLVGSARPTGGESGGTAPRILDLDAAAQQEVVAEPSTLSFGTAAGDPLGIERTLTVRNLSTRALALELAPTSATAGVEVTVSPEKLRLRPGRATEVVARASTVGFRSSVGAASGEVELRGTRTRTVRVRWSLAAPDPKTDLLSAPQLRTTDVRITDATPAVLSIVVGAVVRGASPQVRPVDLLQVQLWRKGNFMGVLAKRRELLPGRYTFGLTGRGARGGRLRRGEYTVRIVARPSDGTRRQAETVPYVVR